MTQLIVYEAGNPANVLLDTRDFQVIAEAVSSLGARIERWEASHPLKTDASSEEILTAYAPEIDRLKSERGYTNADVVHIKPGNPNWPALRQKFLGEHIHDEDEVRFFVEGSGAFYLHIGDKVYEVVGEAGDLLSVPHGVKHWFDGGPVGNFTVIRLFTNQEGWIAHFTGDDISATVPYYNEAA
ncbi:1,2-dihydroxy-3-keto-5-methylthiopentene dioxygenase [Oryzibacter oryziterrae]|uniref:1,2-dihydroxy-3-keto-5-methylthiopentene dioxygenase n=1 Tax=Oryzibacter oryziterrae TaxID=2766474 RepID=UPI001F3195B3|nr:acireductone dioxygenase [Oryzibacter oryziterrae]